MFCVVLLNRKKMISGVAGISCSGHPNDLCEQVRGGILLIKEACDNFFARTKLCLLVLICTAARRPVYKRDALEKRGTGAEA